MGPISTGKATDETWWVDTCFSFFCLWLRTGGSRRLGIFGDYDYDKENKGICGSGGVWGEAEN